ACDAAADPSPPPPFLADLGLDQVVAKALTGREEYHLEPLFLAGPKEPAAVRFRQEAARELEDPDVQADVRSFTEAMRRARGHLAQAEKRSNAWQARRARLAAARTYCEAAQALASALARRPPASPAFQGVRDYLARYVKSPDFQALSSASQEVLRSLDGVTYLLALRGNRVEVMPFRDEPDLGREVAETFAKFRGGEAKSYAVAFPEPPFLNHVEEAILDRVARLYPQPFQALDEFCRRNERFLDEGLLRLEREVAFHLAYLDLIAPLRQAGLPFCYPELTIGDRREVVRDAFDLALALVEPRRAREIVLNGYELRDEERAIVVTGPNHGGKTTFARAIGQLHHLAGLGLAVPARAARLLLPDRIFTHFPREEALADLRGRLEDELVRLREILREASHESLVVLNETFGSTSVQDGLRLGRAALAELLARGGLTVFVTFLDELASLDPRVVSMVAEVSADDPSVRTFRLTRRPADGLAYALSVARKHGLAYEELKERIRR
ncbi:MAG: DNA mismatch repair protein MutS, partial [Clostridia bacterium]|nr:DNA mismatch repair protein MutS [Clostridia bacterium]